MTERIIYSTDTDQLKGLLNGRELFAIVDRKVKGLPFLKRFGRNIIYLETSEKMKKMATVEKIAKKMMARGVDRTWLLVGVGGGIVTDITGFVASIYKRGINFGFIPTTLLAMTDAAIGGKNGVNMLAYKNMVGTIRQPKFVYVCPQFLKSFSPTELYKGIPELLKVFPIDGKDYFYAADFFVRQYEQVCKNEKLDMPTWQELITKAIRIKCQCKGMSDPFCVKSDRFIKHSFFITIINIFNFVLCEVTNFLISDSLFSKSHNLSFLTINKMVNHR